MHSIRMDTFVSVKQDRDAMGSNVAGSMLSNVLVPACGSPCDWQLLLAWTSRLMSVFCSLSCRAEQEGVSDDEYASLDGDNTASGRNRSSVDALMALSTIADGTAAAGPGAAAQRQLCLEDFEFALRHFKPSGEHAGEYKRQQFDRGQVSSVLQSIGATVPRFGMRVL